MCEKMYCLKCEQKVSTIKVFESSEESHDYEECSVCGKTRVLPLTVVGRKEVVVVNGSHCEFLTGEIVPMEERLLPKYVIDIEKKLIVDFDQFVLRFGYKHLVLVWMSGEHFLKVNSVKYKVPDFLGTGKNVINVDVDGDAVILSSIDEICKDGSYGILSRNPLVRGGDISPVFKLEKKD